MRATLRAKISEARKAGNFSESEIFEDNPKRNPYKRRGYDSVAALSKVFIRDPSDEKIKDLSEISGVVKALEERDEYRIFVRDEAAANKVMEIAKEVAK